MTNLSTLKKEAREEFLATFKCIDPNCDGSGSIPHQVYEGEWEAQQCEYCFVVRFPAADKAEALLDKVVEAVEESVVPEKFKRQDLGNKWNMENGEMSTYWAQTEEEVQMYNDCREEVIEAFKQFRGL